MKQFSLAKIFCIIFLVYTATTMPSPAQNLTTLYNFCSQTDCDDGEYPLGLLVQSSDGNFYGTTYGAGIGGYGTIYKLTPSGSITVLHGFSGLEDGAQPYDGLVRGSDGNFYGVDTIGGNTPSGCGTVYKISPSGTFTWLHRFAGAPNDGCTPWGSLVQASDGSFYGTSAAGGNSNGCGPGGCGTIFRMTPGGALTIVYNFTNQADGASPLAGLLQASDGNLYGETTYGGANNYGTIFRISLNGAFTALHSFNASDGYEAYGGLIQASDGNFYGTTNSGGANPNGGTVFKMTPSGALTTLYSFCSQSNCTDGRAPYGGLVQGRDGNFYGTTYYGGANNGSGTIFGITPSGALTTVYNFCSQSNCADGSHPYAGVIQASDGNFYGVTQYGGSNCNGSGGCGIAFKFQAPHLAVTLTGSVAGQGSITSSDGLINCPGTCTHTYTYGAQVTLTATPASGWDFSGWTGACSGIGPCNLTMNGNLAVTAVFVEPGHGIQFTNVTPCRLVDTRSGSPIQGGSAESFTLPGLSGCNIPTSALAYSLNVTVVPRRQLGYLTIWPTGEAQPVVSTINSPDGRIKANAAIVPAGTSGAVSVYVTDTTDVILDIDGYFQAPDSGTYQFYPLTPCRVVDTRGDSGDLGGPYLHAEVERDFPVRESSCIPSGVTLAAYSMNFTVVPHVANQPLGYLSVWPAGSTMPVVSTLNNPTATVVANAAIVPAGTNGALATYAFNDTDLIVDINGYFASPGSDGYSFYAVAPCRAYDSRANNGQPFQGERTVNIVGSSCAPPSDAQSYVFNATVVPSGSMGYLTLWPDSQQQMPVVSTLNAYDGFITSNMAIVPNLNGSTDSYAAGLTQLILDISGYFAP